MTYRLRPSEVGAVRLPVGPEEGSLLAKPGDWLVVLDEKVCIFTDEDFHRKFEYATETEAPPPISSSRAATSNHRRTRSKATSTLFGGGIEGVATPTKATAPRGTITDLILREVQSGAKTCAN